MSKLYDEDYFDSYNLESLGIRALNNQQIVQDIAGHITLKNATVLDYGAGDQWLGTICRQCGCFYFPYDLHSGVSLQFNHYNIIVLQDVLEHIEDIKKILHFLYRLTTPNCILYITVPDAGGMTARLMGKHWFQIKPEEHLHQFTRQSLTQLVEGAGFKVLKCKSFGKYLTLKYICSILKKDNHWLYKYVSKLPFQNTIIKFHGGFLKLIATKE